MQTSAPGRGLSSASSVGDQASRAAPDVLQCLRTIALPLMDYIFRRPTEAAGQAVAIGRRTGVPKASAS